MRTGACLLGFDICWIDLTVQRIANGASGERDVEGSTSYQRFAKGAAQSSSKILFHWWLVTTTRKIRSEEGHQWRFMNMRLSLPGGRYKEWEPGRLVNPAENAYRVSLSYDESEGGASWKEKFNALLAEPGSGEVTALVVGMWGDLTGRSETRARRSRLRRSV